MNLTEGSFLKPFVAQRLGDLKKAKAKRSIGQLQGKIGEMPMTRGFAGALAAHFATKGEPGVIVEIKGASPFEKNFRRPVNYRDFAEDFEAVGAVCLSVRSSGRHLPAPSPISRRSTRQCISRSWRGTSSSTFIRCSRRVTPAPTRSRFPSRCSARICRNSSSAQQRWRSTLSSKFIRRRNSPAPLPRAPISSL